MSNLPLKSPKHRIEFAGNSARRKKRPPPPWIVGWFGGLLLFAAGASVGGFTAFALMRTLFLVADDVGFFGAVFVLLLDAIVKIVASVVGGIAGLLVWAKLRYCAKDIRESDE